MTEKNNNEIYKKTFVEAITPGISKDDFLKLALKQITEEDKEIFGDDYEKQMLNLMLYFSIFAPYPATFDSNAVAGIVDQMGSSDLARVQDPSLDLEHTDNLIRRNLHILERATELGIIEQNESGRFYIRQETADKLLPILEQFED